MTDKQIIIDGTHCKYAHFDGGNTQRLLCAIDDCFCDCYRENECYYKQLKRKEQECEELKKDLHQNFKEKDELHLIIDRLLEASGYDTNTASAEDFEDVYEHIRYEQQQLDQLKFDYAELEKRHNDGFEQFKKLKEQLEAYKMEAEEGKEINAELKAENEKLQDMASKLLDERNKYLDKWGINLIYKQTLTEIKEICNNNNELKGDFNLVDCDKYKLGKHNLANRILQKISEVENGV